jgi:hypothetical protein
MSRFEQILNLFKIFSTDHKAPTPEIRIKSYDRITLKKIFKMNAL